MRASKRQQVVDTATELFSMHGFHPVGVDAIIDASGVARMTLYRHFEGKDDLIREVLEQRCQMILDSIGESMQAKKTAVERLKAIFDWYGSWFETPTFAGCLFERALAEFGTAYPKVSDIAIRYRESLTAIMTDTLAELSGAASARRLASVGMMLLDGATVEARAFGDPSSAGKAWQAMQQLLPVAPKAPVRASKRSQI